MDKNKDIDTRFPVFDFPKFEMFDTSSLLPDMEEMLDFYFVFKDESENDN